MPAQAKTAVPCTAAEKATGPPLIPRGRKRGSSGARKEDGIVGPNKKVYSVFYWSSILEAPAVLRSRAAEPFFPGSRSEARACDFDWNVRGMHMRISEMYQII